MATKTTTKTKQSVKPTLKTKETLLKTRAQKFADLQEEMDLLQELPIFADYDEAKDKLREITDMLYAPDKGGKVPVKQGDVSFTVCRASNSIDEAGKQRIIEELGIETFIALATIPITALREYLSKKTLDEVVQVERTGARTLKLKKK